MLVDKADFSRSWIPCWLPPIDSKLEIYPCGWKEYSWINDLTCETKYDGTNTTSYDGIKGGYETCILINTNNNNHNNNNIIYKLIISILFIY